MRNKPALEGQADHPSELWKCFREGDREAFATIYQAYAEPLFSYGYRVSMNENVVKDAIQDLFVELWKSRENLDQAIDVKSYLFKSLRYKLIRRGKLKILYVSDESINEWVSGEELSVESSIVKKESGIELTGKVNAAVLTLSLRQQEAVALKFYHGFTNEQIASIMGVNYQSATNILHRAILLLRKHFTSHVITVLSCFFCFPGFF